MSSNNETSKETLIVEDLKRIFIRAQDDTGLWGAIGLDVATDKQFDEWAKSKMEIRGKDGPWSPEERVDFCTLLWREGALHMLRKEVAEED